MKICVCGWYFLENFYDALHRLNELYPVTVIAHKEPPDDFICDFDVHISGNIGLEWGAYNEYLQDFWDGTDSILFCHDDIDLSGTHLNGDGILVTGEDAIRGISKLNCDQAYVFQNRTEDAKNFGRHGRMVFMSHAFLAKMQGKGFWYDPNNHGYVGTGIKPKGCLHYNAAIEEFHKEAALTGLKVHYRAYAPALKFLIRGQEGLSLSEAVGG